LAGDHCHGCRRPYRHGEVSFIGYDGKRLTIVGRCCVRRLSSIVCVSVYCKV
jgi:hypothetical protein